MGAFDDLAEERGGGGFVGRMSGGLLVFGFIGRRVEERDGEMNRKDLRVRVLLCQAAGVQQSLVGSVCELSAVHVGAECEGRMWDENELISDYGLSCDTRG